MKKSLKYSFLRATALMSLTAVSQAATIVTPDIASANISGLSGRPITETIDGSGFTSSATDITDWYHEKNTNSADYFLGDRNGVVNSTVEFTFTFNTAVDVDTVHFWTYDRNTDSPGREIKDFDISFSTNGGTSYGSTTSLTNWLDRDGAEITVDGVGDRIGHQSKTFTRQNDVTNIKFSSIVAHNDSNRYVGFSEIRFGSPDAIPEPSTTALLGLGGLALILRRRK
jgi:hypothetical protein